MYHKRNPIRRPLAYLLLSLMLLSACTPVPAPTVTAVAQSIAGTPTTAGPTEPAATITPPATATAAATATSIPPTPRPALAATPVPTAETYRIDALTYSIRQAYYTLVNNLAVPFDKKKLAVAALTGLVDGLRLRDADRDEALNVQFSDDTDKNYQILKERFETLVPKYGIGKLPVTLMRDMVNQMAQAVGDEHTYYLDPDQASQQNGELIGDQSYAGIGVSTRKMDDGRGVVVDVFPNSPAEKGGMKQGDILLKVDGRDVTGKNSDYVKLIRGPAGSQVTITVQRAGESQPLTLTFTRGKVAQPVMISRVLDGTSGKIGYIRIYEFTRATGLPSDYPLIDQVTDALKQMDQQQIKSLILDLRDNPGGDLLQVELIASLFIPNQDGKHYLGTIRDAQGHEQPIPLTGRLWSKQYPLAVLVNNGSGSGAEVLPLALKEYKAGYLIGQKTAGAVGTTTDITLLDDSQLWYTSSVIYGPVSKVTPNQKGIQPDQEVIDPTPEDYAAGKDPQLQAAEQYLNSK